MEQEYWGGGARGGGWELGGESWLQRKSARAVIYKHPWVAAWRHSILSFPVLLDNFTSCDLTLTF